MEAPIVCMAGGGGGEAGGGAVEGGQGGQAWHGGSGWCSQKLGDGNGERKSKENILDLIDNRFDLHQRFPI